MLVGWRRVTSRGVSGSRKIRSGEPVYAIFSCWRAVRRFRLFINGENLTGVRQTKWDPLIRPTRAPDGRWTVDAWAPLEGRNINGGLRLAF